ncbi:glycosyltransferase family 2 protein [Exiguobacterium sp. SH5S13]|uniref:glycosyltransferase family 2 protein n=1 Tax=Exiguobacterium sp. SH5S13 TaxID=2510959 RepID=UPI0013759687|nr:glycosyltransferase family 2 protein [Exiguobacterium sp. SH5S13]
MLTILTPTYNRVHTLPRLYESLKKQKIKEFEWVIIDDGSVDNTQEQVESWILDGEIQISYYKQRNGGKHRALNYGVTCSSYNYIYIIDSDDYMTENGTQAIFNWISEVKSNDMLAGVSGLRGRETKNGYEIIGQFPKGKEYVDANNLERTKFKLLGDKAEIYKKEILVKYPFPEFENENFLSEEAVWNRIAADGFKVRWYGEVICICEYLEDGLTKNSSDKMRLNNFQGYTYTQKVNSHLKPFPSYAFDIGEYARLGKKRGLSNTEIMKNLDVNIFSFCLAINVNTIRRMINLIRR